MTKTLLKSVSIVNGYKRNTIQVFDSNNKCMDMHLGEDEQEITDFIEKLDFFVIALKSEYKDK